jgi:uncharacterized protein
LIPRSKLAAPSGTELAAVAILGVSNVLLNRTSRALQAPAALAASALLVLLARRSGATDSQLGIDRESLPRGIQAGLAAGIPIAAVSALGGYLPKTARFFRDERTVHVGALGAAHEVLVRIPLATAAAEELMFRGALEAILAQRRSRAETVLISAVLFGAWHILPALSHPGTERVHSGSKARQVLAVGSICVVTGAGALALSWLRERSGSIAAPTIVHFAANSGGFLGAWLAARRSDR